MKPEIEREIEFVDPFPLYKQEDGSLTLSYYRAEDGTLKLTHELKTGYMEIHSSFIDGGFLGLVQSALNNGGWKVTSVKPYKEHYCGILSPLEQ